jgi:hypothetical protein
MGLTGLVAAGLGLLASAAEAAPPSENLRQALEAKAGRDNARLVGQAQGGALNDADEAMITFEVDPNKAYKLYSVCDSDCTELSVSADDANGDTIDWSGSVGGASPMLNLDDFSGSTIKVEVFMMNCKADPCAFAVALAEAPGSRRTVSDIAALSAVLGGGAIAGDAKPAASEQELVAELKERIFDSWKLVGEIGLASLKTGEARRYVYEVDPAFIYEGRASCDCANLDLVFYDAGDRELDSDFASDSRPMIEISSDNWSRERRTGRQRLVLEVKMKECGRDSCKFAAGVYRAN